MTGNQPATPAASLRQVLMRVANGPDAGSSISGRVRESWKRAAQAGLVPDRIHAPYDPDVDDDGRLRWAAAPVLAAVTADLPDLPIALLLADERGHVVDRWTRNAQHARLMDSLGAAPGFVCDEAVIGTNSIGLAAYSGAAAVVRGFEHYADALTRVSCASSPVLDPTTGLSAAVLNITSTETYNALMPALVGRLVHEIGQRLLADRGLDTSALYGAFARARLRAKGPLVAVDGITMFVNTSAGAVVGSTDREQLWQWAQRHVGAHGEAPSLDSGATPVRCEQVFDGATHVGALIWLLPDTPQPLPGRYAFALTSSEHSIAEHVAGGLTNREIAAALSISPHTVDYHLRQIFQKLNLRSRVELAQIIRHGSEDGTDQRAAALG